MRTRKVLQEVQVPAINDSSFVGASSEMNKNNTDGKAKKKPVGRPKRKNAVMEKTLKKSSKEVLSKQPETNSKLEDGKENCKDSGLGESVILNQSRIETFLTPCPAKKSENLISENKGSADKLTVSGNAHKLTFSDLADNSTLSRNILEGIAMITSDSPSEGYWKEIAEQRRQALEKVLLENELVTDQLSVLQTENQLLKSALEAAEKLLKMEGLID